METPNESGPKLAALRHRKAVAAFWRRCDLTQKARDAAIILLRQIGNGFTARKKSSPGFGLVLR